MRSTETQDVRTLIRARQRGRLGDSSSPLGCAVGGAPWIPEIAKPSCGRHALPNVLAMAVILSQSIEFRLTPWAPCR